MRVRGRGRGWRSSRYGFAVACALSCAPPGRAPEAPTVTGRDAASSASAPPSAARTLFRALNGDVIVFKLMLGYSEHPRVAAIARDLGAEAAEPQMLVESVLPGSDDRLLLRGYTRAGLDRLAPFLRAGTVAELEAGQLGLSGELGPKLGDVFELLTEYVGDPSNPRDRRIRVGALLAFPAPFEPLAKKTLVTSVDRARGLYGLSEGNVTAVCVWLRNPSMIAGFASALDAALREKLPIAGSSDVYRVFTSEQLDPDCVDVSHRCLAGGG